MRIFHPNNEAEFRTRDELLQRSLREVGAPFPISTEYPLVLSSKDSRFSYCLDDEGVTLAHANLWPRILSTDDGRSVQVGLIGNVATDEAKRGRGLMRALLGNLLETARAKGLKALFLWSDLQVFYQKLGFRSCGDELRFSYRTDDLPIHDGWRLEPSPIAPSRTRALLAARYHHLPTLERSAEEFSAQLTVPNSHVVVLNRAKGYAVIGKGMDMMGVVHEWGAPDAHALLSGIRAAAKAQGLEQVMLLTPVSLDAAWRLELARPAEHVSAHKMGWVWCEDESLLPTLERTFIWGPDSI